MKKITLKLSPSEWKRLIELVNKQIANIQPKTDKFTKAILIHTLHQVHQKLHTRLTNLQPVLNRLNLTYPEAAVLAIALLELDSSDYMITSITGQIDQKLT